MIYILSGGGSGGPITPLLALAEEIKQRDSGAKFLFTGPDDHDPSRQLAESNGMEYFTIRAGKLKRYFALDNLLSPWKNMRGFFQALKFLDDKKPRAVFSAGSYGSLPLAWAAFFRHIPVFIHQQDIKAGFANKLMAPVAAAISVTFVKTIKSFPRKKTFYSGNPVRKSILQGNREKAFELFSLRRDRPVLLILGGGTGALAINNLIKEALPRLLEYFQIIHIAGKGKNVFQDQAFQETHRFQSIETLEKTHIDKHQLRDYHVHEFLTDEMASALAVADIVLTRAGMATLTELCALGKATVIIPMPNSHQEANVAPFQKEEAAIILNQKTLTPEILFNELKLLLEHPEKRKTMARAMTRVIKSRDAARQILDTLEKTTPA